MVSIINRKERKGKLDRPYLRQLRKAEGLRQDEMAKRLGISLQHFKNIEAGFSDPSYGVLETFSRVFPKVKNVWKMFQKVEKNQMRETKLDVKKEFTSIENIEVKTNWGK